MHIEYPKFLYHKTEQPKVVHTQEQADQLGSEWKATPADVDQPEVEMHPPTDPTPTEAPQIIMAEADTDISSKKKK